MARMTPAWALFNTKAAKYTPASLTKLQSAHIISNMKSGKNAIEEDDNK